MQTRDSLDADAKSDAEAAANLFVDSQFAAWDRTGWTGGDVPQEIERLARDRASFEYLLLIYQGKTPDWVKEMGGKTVDDAAQIIAAGGPILDDGTRQAQLTTADPAVPRRIEIQTG